MVLPSAESKDGLLIPVSSPIGSSSSSLASASSKTAMGGGRGSMGVPFRVVLDVEDGDANAVPDAVVLVAFVNAVISVIGDRDEVKTGAITAVGAPPPALDPRLLLLPLLSKRL